MADATSITPLAAIEAMPDGRPPGQIPILFRRFLDALSHYIASEQALQGGGSIWASAMRPRLDEAERAQTEVTHLITLIRRSPARSLAHESMLRLTLLADCLLGAESAAEFSEACELLELPGIGGAAMPLPPDPDIDGLLAQGVVQLRALATLHGSANDPEEDAQGEPSG